MKYMQYYAKKFLNHPETWKQWQLAKLTTMLSYAQRHCAYYKKHIIGEVRIDNSMEIIKSLPLLDKNIVRQQEKYIYSDEIYRNFVYFSFYNSIYKFIISASLYIFTQVA